MLVLAVSASTRAQYEPPRDQGFSVFSSRGVKIGPGQEVSYKFSVTTYLRRARLAGNIVAQGGSGNDIRVRVTRNQRTVYDSGQRRTVVLSVPITEPGEYTLIVSNGFSLISAKVASGYVNLLYDGIDNERAQTEAQSTSRRMQTAQQILDRLYLALQSDERELGTFQVPIKPTITVAGNEELNATAFPQANAIFMNRGTFELAETFPEKEQDILAGVIGHELSHVFYRHPKGRPTGLTIWDELSGVLPIDRTQEREADVLGIRLACQAGFDPAGLVMFIEGLRARNGDGSDFGATHPQNNERIGYLRQEVFNCAYAGGHDNLSVQPSGTIPYPSSQYTTYSELDLLKVGIPDNWRELPQSASSIWFAPNGGYGQVNGQAVFSYGVNFGLFQGRLGNLQQATNELIARFTQQSRNLRQSSNYQRTSLNGRLGLTVNLSNLNEATGNPEMITVVTTQLRSGELFYAIFVSPATEYQNYQKTFSRILQSILLNR
jgi:hypothetical protein